eukprot:746364-Hanusia_phi.AAC.2
MQQQKSAPDSPCAPPPALLYPTVLHHGVVLPELLVQVPMVCRLGPSCSQGGASKHSKDLTTIKGASHLLPLLTLPLPPPAARQDKGGRGSKRSLEEAAAAESMPAVRLARPLAGLEADGARGMVGVVLLYLLHRSR